MPCIPIFVMRRLSGSGSKERVQNCKDLEAKLMPAFRMKVLKGLKTRRRLLRNVKAIQDWILSSGMDGLLKRLTPIVSWGKEAILT